MKNLGFRLKIHFDGIRRHKLLPFMMLLTLVVALLFPTLTISNIVYAWERRSSYPEIPHAVQIRFDGFYEQSYDMEEKLEELDLGPLTLARRGRAFRELILYDGDYELAHLEGIDQNAFDHFYTLYKGRGFSQEEQEQGAQVALVNYSAFMQNKMSLGEKVHILGQPMEIIGVVMGDFSTMTLTLPEKTMEKTHQAETISQELFVWGENLNAQRLQVALTPLASHSMLFEVSSGVREREMYQYSNKEAVKRNLLEGSLALLFSSSCFLFMNLSRLDQQAKNWGIKLSQGATKDEQVVDAVLDTLFFSLPALFVIYGILYAFRSEISRISTLYFNFIFLTLSFLLTIFLSLLIGALNGYLITRRPLIIMLEER